MQGYTATDRTVLYEKVNATLKENKAKPLTSIKNKKAANEVQLLQDLEISSFTEKLKEHNKFPFRSEKLEILQINLGYLCNQVCNHCHVNAGPSRKELMTKETMEACLKALDTGSFNTVDLTGGAPEIHPDFKWFVEEIAKRSIHIIVRSNLTILTFHEDYEYLPEFFKKHKVEVIASMPCYTIDNVDKQRGEGVFDASIEGLQILNKLGYGKQNTGLQLNLVFNPGGASLPGAQEALERDYKRVLKSGFDVDFNSLYTITNMPISRFLSDLKKQNKLETYMQLLLDNFNPGAVDHVMCKNTISIRWDGTIFDCDFNQMLNLPVSNSQKNINKINIRELVNRNIVVKNHCFGCTAGAGSSCQGTIS